MGEPRSTGPFYTTAGPAGPSGPAGPEGPPGDLPAAQAYADSVAADAQTAAEAYADTVSAAAQTAATTAAATYTDTEVGAITIASLGGIAKSTFDAKGDMLVATGDNAFDNLPVGNNLEIPFALSTEATGISWGPIISSGTHAARLAASHTNSRLWRETDTGLIYWDALGGWGFFKREGTVIKTSNEIVNNSAALQDDNELFWPVEANEVWVWKLMLVCGGASTTADFKATMTVPTGTSGGFFLGSETGGVDTATTPTSGTQYGTAKAFGGKNSGFFPFATQLNGYMNVGSTAGTAQFQWAQNNATAENNTIFADSYLELRRLA